MTTKIQKNAKIVKSKKTKRQVKKTNWFADKWSRLNRAQAIALVFGVVFGIIGIVYTALSSAYTINATTWNTYANGLRQCESGNNYKINTGNGYYGAYQFSHATWASVGGTSYSSNAHTAPKSVQDYYAYKLFKSRGFQPWSCWNKNISPTRIAWWGNPNHYASTGSLTSSTSTSSISNPYTPNCPTGEEKIVGYGYTTSGSCVKKLQWDLNKIQSAGLTIDGAFGPRTLAATKTYQSKHGLTADGVVGRRTWSSLNSLYK